MPMPADMLNMENFTIIIPIYGVIYTCISIDTSISLWYNNKDKTKERNGC